jgi:alpha-tubulin suppressor-like RCC1 family protein
VLSGCRDKNPAGPGEQAPTLVVTATSASPQQMLAFVVRGSTVPAEMSGTFGSAPIRAKQLDDSTAILVVPEIAPGRQELKLAVGPHKLSATVTVEAAPVVANPTAYVESVLGGMQQDLDALAARFADPLQRPPGVDAGAFDALRGEMKRAMEDARRELAAATPEQRAQVAAFLNVNASLLHLPGSAPSGSAQYSRSGSGSSIPRLFCTTLDNWIDCVFRNLTVIRNVGLVYGIGMGLAEATAWWTSPLGKAIVRVINIGGAGILLGWAATQVWDYLTTPVVTESLEPWQTEYQPAVSGELRSMAAPALRDTLVFGNAGPRKIFVRAQVRSLTAADLTRLPQLKGIAERLGELPGIWNKVASGIPFFKPTAPAAPAEPRKRTAGTVSPLHLSLGAVAPGEVKGAAAAADKQWQLTFQREGLTADLPFTFEIKYAPPGLPVRADTVAARLSPSAFRVAFAGGGIVKDTVRFVNRQSQRFKLVNPDGTEATGIDYAQVSVAGNTNAQVAVTSVRNASGFDLQLSTSEAGEVRTQFDLRYNGQKVQMIQATIASGSFTQVSVGVHGHHTCALTAAGQAFCWGSNSHHQISPSNSSQAGIFAAAAGLVFKMISAGANHTCGITPEGDAYCWGRNQAGQIGDGTGGVISSGYYVESTVPRPTKVSGDLKFTTISAGADHTCGVTVAGRGYCWGGNQNGQVGNGHTPRPAPIPVAVAGGYTFSTISAGADLSCGVSGSAVLCWGNHNLDVSITDVPWRVKDLSASSVMAGGSGACGVSGATLNCWGGALNGFPSRPWTGSWTPTPIPGAFTNAAVGLGHSCALTSSGEAYCWGKNENGQLGNGVFSSSRTTTPVAVTGGLTFASISVGSSSSCGITREGATYCWGGRRGLPGGWSHTPVLVKP